MKKILVSIMALISVATVAMAQDEQKSDNCPQKMDRTEMVKNFTQMMVKKYGLSDEQATQLQALNEKQMPMPMMGGPRHGRGPENGDSIHGQRPPRPEMGDSTQCKCPQNGEHKGGHKGGHRGGPDMTEYNNELQKIMTADQYKAYSEDMEKMKNQRPPRREKENENK